MTCCSPDDVVGVTVEPTSPVILWNVRAPLGLGWAELSGSVMAVSTRSRADRQDTPSPFMSKSAASTCGPGRHPSHPMTVCRQGLLGRGWRGTPASCATCGGARGVARGDDASSVLRPPGWPGNTDVVRSVPAGAAAEAVGGIKHLDAIDEQPSPLCPKRGRAAGCFCRISRRTGRRRTTPPLIVRVMI